MVCCFCDSPFPSLFYFIRVIRLTINCAQFFCFCFPGSVGNLIPIVFYLSIPRFHLHDLFLVVFVTDEFYWFIHHPSISSKLQDHFVWCLLQYILNSSMSNFSILIFDAIVFGVVGGFFFYESRFDLHNLLNYIFFT